MKEFFSVAALLLLITFSVSDVVYSWDGHHSLNQNSGDNHWNQNDSGSHWKQNGGDSGGLERLTLPVR